MSAMRTRTTRPADIRRTERRTAHPGTRHESAPRTSEDRVRQAGGPEDLAFYRCGCGYTFAGDVSTNVSCPHCGGEQAW
jgi:rubrerythrin